MGLFDKFSVASSNTVVAYAPASEQEAWLAIMYACIAADGQVAEVESSKLCELVVFKSFFNGFQVIELYKKAAFAHKDHGSKHLIDSSAGLIKEENKPTLFALIMELLLSDGIMGTAEKEIVEYLSSAMKLDESLSEKIVEVMMIKNKGNTIITS
jgi:hypothetical protein